MFNKHYQMLRLHGDALYYDKKKDRVERDGYVRRVGGRARHQVIMENILGRKLVRGKIVHHINLNKLDNSKENLFLCKDRKHHNSKHHELQLLGAELLKLGIIKFEDGHYKKVE